MDWLSRLKGRFVTLNRNWLCRITAHTPADPLPETAFISVPFGDVPNQLPDETFAGSGNLSAINPYSPTWLFVKEWAEDRLKTVREKNDSINKDMTQTAALRGEIKILKELINLPNPRKGLLTEE